MRFIFESEGIGRTRLLKALSLAAIFSWAMAPGMGQAETAPDPKTQPVLLCAYALSSPSTQQDRRITEARRAQNTSLVSLADQARQAAAAAQSSATAAAAAKTAAEAATAATAAASAATSAAAAASDAAAGQQFSPQSLPAECAGGFPRGHLSGPGDLVVLVTKESWTRAKAVSQQATAYPRLFINGIPAGGDTVFLGTDSSSSDNVVRLRFHIGTDSSQFPLWVSIFRDRGLIDALPARVSLGWGGPSATTDSIGNGPTISVARHWQVGLAIIGLLLAGAITLWCLFYTDIFRDAATEAWWASAARYRREWVLLARRKKITKSHASFNTEFAKFLNNCGISNQYPPTDADEYRNAAESILLTRQPLAGDTVKIGAATIGLILSEKQWTPIRQTYSLSRIQAGAWLLFVVAAGLFIFLVTKGLPDLDSSLVALLGLSAATTAASIAIDSRSGGRPFTPSQGILSDITTGWDGNQQLHRSQALIVNILLLCVGISHVVQDLSFPVFSATWLSLLGISGLAQTLGKQALETGNTPAPTMPTTPTTPLKVDTTGSAATQGSGTGNTPAPQAPAPPISAQPSV